MLAAVAAAAALAAGLARLQMDVALVEEERSLLRRQQLRVGPFSRVRLTTALLALPCSHVMFYAVPSAHEQRVEPLAPRLPQPLPAAHRVAPRSPLSPAGQVRQKVETAAAAAGAGQETETPHLRR